MRDSSAAIQLSAGILFIWDGPPVHLAYISKKVETSSFTDASTVSLVMITSTKVGLGSIALN